MNPELSKLFKSREPSAIRLAQIEFGKRKEKIKAIDVAIGNVSLPMHPKLIERMGRLRDKESPFKEGVVKYTPTSGLKETKEAFLKIIASSGFKTEGLYAQITDGGSAAMELVIAGISGRVGRGERPLLLIEPAYPNYRALAERLGRKVISVRRRLQEEGTFSLPDKEEIEKIIVKNKPGGIVVIPYDNPTGQFYGHKKIVELGRAAVKYNMWLVSDEAYRELFYMGGKTSSIWGLTEEEVTGIGGRRISIESASKVWNGCGLRIGALVTDNQEFHERAVAEYTANLSPPAIDQYIFGGLAAESEEELKKWYGQQREYYKEIMEEVTAELKKELPELIVSSPEASIYSVLDLRKIEPEFEAKDFVLWCAREGKVKLEGEEMTLLVAPMEGFYSVKEREENPGKSQIRIAYVLPKEEMKLVPRLLKELLGKYKELR